jgi:hypothetical protein
MFSIKHLLFPILLVILSYLVPLLNTNLDLILIKINTVVLAFATLRYHSCLFGAHSAPVSQHV